MKIIVEKSLIESILLNMQNFLEKKDITKITSHILLDGNSSGLTVKATDGEIGLSVTTDQPFIDHNGSATADGKKLLSIVRILKDGEIILELIGNNLTIQQNRSKFKLPTFDPRDFPKYPLIGNKSRISLNSNDLIYGLKRIFSSIDSNNPKFELNGALLNIKRDKTELVGTDTRRLSISTIHHNSSDELSIIIPKKAISTIKKLFIGSIDIFYDNTDIIIRSSEYYFYSRLINGKFPDYERIIPRDVNYTLRLPKKEIVSAIRLINSVSQDIQIKFNRDSLQFQSISTDSVKAETELQFKTNLDGFELNVNSRYVLDFINEIGGEEFEILLNEPTLPFVLKDKKFITVIMPIIV